MLRIYRPAKTAMQSGQAGTHAWVAEFEPAVARTADPLMGWVSSADTRPQLRLKFPSMEDAVAYAQRKGMDYVVNEPKERRIRPKNYSDNFRFDRLS